MTAAPTKAHVFYTTPHDGWAVTILDANDYQIGEATYTYLKSDAVLLAKEEGLPVHVFGRNGLHQRTIAAGA